MDRINFRWKQLESAAEPPKKKRELLPGEERQMMLPGLGALNTCGKEIGQNTQGTCGVCGGDSVVRHPLWKEYDEWEEEYQRQLLEEGVQDVYEMSIIDILFWWNLHGVTVNSLSDLPPSHIPCPGCGGGLR